MIVSCPHCATDFALPDEALGKAGRKVRCGACSHVWLQTAEPAGPTLDSPVTMEPTHAVMIDAPGCLPPDLLEVDAPIGAGALDIPPIDLVAPDAGAEFSGAGEEALTPDAHVPGWDEAEEDPGQEPEAEPAAPDAPPATEPREDIAAKPSDAADAPAPEAPATAAQDGPVPDAWRAPGLAALAPLVAAIAADEARRSPARDINEAATPEPETPEAATPEAATPEVKAPEAVAIAEAPAPEIVAAAYVPAPEAALPAPEVPTPAAPEAVSPRAAEPEAALPRMDEPQDAAPVPVEIAAPELALLAATTLAAPSAAELAETVPMPPIEIPGPPGPPTIIVALRDERARESDGLDAIAPPPGPVIDDDLRPEESVAPEIAAARLKRHRRLRYGAVLGALALIAGGMAANEATQPDGATLLAAIRTGGAPTTDRGAADAGLGFANVNTHRTAIGGVPMLMVTGEVVNDSPRPRAVPLLRGALLLGERELHNWTFNAGTPRLDPGARASFETVLRNPATGATDVRVTFSAPGS